MKKSILLLSFLMITLLCSCSLLEKKPDVLGIISFGDTARINIAKLENSALYNTFTAAADDNGEAEAIEQIMAKEPFAAVICGPCDMGEIISAAKKYNLPVLFIGAESDEEALSGYDKAWCFSASENQGGELLGAKIGNAFKQKSINDQNLDDILQCLEISNGNTDATNSAVKACEALGVYCSGDKISAATRESAAEQVKELYADKMPPEFILCSDEQLALGAKDALAELDKTVPIAYIHNSITLLKLSSPDLFSAALLPGAEMEQAAKAFIENILANEAVNINTDYRLDKNKTAYFIYTLS